MPPATGEHDRADDGAVGSLGDHSGGFRIAGGNLLFTPSGAQSFSPGSWVPLGGHNPNPPPAGEQNDFGGGHSGDHVGAFRSGPSIFAQHGSGANPSQGEDHGGQDRDGPNGPSKRARSPSGRPAGENHQPPPQLLVKDERHSEGFRDPTEKARE